MANPTNVIPMRWGARPEDWQALAHDHGLLVDLLPVVSNPNAKISPLSSLKQLGKTPSRYNVAGEAAGIKDWTEKRATEAEIAAWSRNGDLGICIQTRRLRAIDVDIDDWDTVSLVVDCLNESIGRTGYPIRTRSNSSKILVPVRVAGPLTKRRLILPDNQGAVELLADGQQFVAVGTHPTGVRYGWPPHGDSPPADVVFPTLDELEGLWLRLRDVLGAKDERREAAKSRLEAMSDAVQRDPVAVALYDRGAVLDVGADGQLFVTCPNADEHTTESAISSTAYYAAHTGGYERGHWVCLHAHCAGKPDSFFEQKLDLIEFEDLSGEAGAPPAQGSDAPPGETPVTQGKAARFTPKSLAAFLASESTTRWRVKHVLPAAGTGTVFGPSGAAKSFVVLDLLLHIAIGRAWQGHRVEQGRVVYLAAEGQGGVARRLRAWCAYHELDPSDIDLAVVDHPPNLLQREDAVALAAAIGKCSVLAIDTAMAVAAGGDENSSEDMGRLMKFAGLLATSTGGLVLLVHHAGKDVTRGQRGWSGLKGAIDVELEVSRLDGGREGEEAGDLRQIRLSKVRDGPLEGEAWTFQLTDVPLGVDADGDEYASAVCEFVERPPSASGPRRKKPLGSLQAIILETIIDELKLGDSVATATLRDRVYPKMTQAKNKRDTRDQRFDESMDSLVARGEIAVHNDVVTRR